MDRNLQQSEHHQDAPGLVPESLGTQEWIVIYCDLSTISMCHVQYHKDSEHENGLQFAAIWAQSWCLRFDGLLYSQCGLDIFYVFLIRFTHNHGFLKVCATLLFKTWQSKQSAWEGFTKLLAWGGLREGSTRLLPVLNDCNNKYKANHTRGIERW